MTELPIDWTEPSDMPYHGITRSERLGGYLVTLLLNRKQVQFGPFRQSRGHAAFMHDRLMKYFLPFVKAKPIPNCPAEVFDRLVNSETEELFGEARLQSRYTALRQEAQSVGLNIGNEEAVRIKFIREGAGLLVKASKLVESVNRTRRRSLIRLESLSLKNATSYDLTGLVRGLSIPKEKWTAELIADHEAVDLSFRAAQRTLVEYIQELKTALDLDPNLSTK